MNKFVFLKEYASHEIEENNRLVKSSIENLPYTLALPIKQLAIQIESGNYGKGMNYALDFFEVSMQYLSCYLFIKLQKEQHQEQFDKNSLIRFINKIDSKRPLSFGDWINDLFSPLMQMASQNMADDELVINLSKWIVGRKFNVLLGSKKEPSIVQIRNEYRGHSTTLSEDIYKGVIYTLESRLLLMLKALEPMQRLQYFSCIDNDDKQCTLLSHKGHVENKTYESQQHFIKGHYYISESVESNHVYDLFPLVFCNDKGYVYVFQTLKEESISYLSSNLNAITYNSDCWNESLDKLFQQTVPSFDISKDINMAEIKTLTDNVSNGFLKGIYKERKYNRELFVERDSLSKLLYDFCNDSRPLFPLLGEAGQGKTNQLCFWTEEFIKSNHAVLIFSSSDFINCTLDDKLRRIFNISPRKDIKKAIDKLHERALQSNCFIYLFFDAINECLSYGDNHEQAGPIALYNAFRKLFINDHYTQFKVLFTCRSYTWRNLFQQHTVVDNPYIFSPDDDDNIAVRGFTKNELSKAYEIYGDLYQMKTPFEKLTPTSTIRLKDPLVLKIACTNFLGQNFPDEVLSYTSIKLFDDMLQNIKNSYAGNKQCKIIYQIAQYLLQQYESGNPIDRISVNMLRDAYYNHSSPLHQLAKLIFKTDGTTIAYTELLNKPERPILRSVTSIYDDKGEEIQFIYERFLEYVLALAFVNRETAKNPIIKSEIYVTEIELVKSSTVFIGAMRNAIIIDYLRTNDFSTIITLIRDYSDNYEVTSLMNEVMNVLIRENYEDVLFNLIDTLLSQQIPMGQQLIEEFNSITRKIEGNEADETIIARHKELYKTLSPIIHLRKIASLSTINGIFLTDYFNDGLYKNNPYRLLWSLMTDPIVEIGNDSCLYAYYLSNKTRTLEYTPLKENLAEKIVKEMYAVIKNDSLIKCGYNKNRRKQVIVFLETATRIATLLIIDELMQKKDNSKQLVTELLEEIQSVFSFITFRFKLIKLFMPFLQLLLRKQVTFQSAYVNNTIEYQTFWMDDIIPQHQDDGWCRNDMKEIANAVMYKKEEVINNEQLKSFFHKSTLNAYYKADSFSYFILERLMVMIGTESWETVKPIMKHFFSDQYRNEEWFDYSQMSMIYVLYQIGVNSTSQNQDLLNLYENEFEEWTLRCRGLFKARNSHKANTIGLYKRNVMNWYSVIYCKHTGDGVAHKGDEHCVPIFYKLINVAIESNDKELLFHLIENISELISDNGFIHTGLQLLLYIMMQYDSQYKVEKIDAAKLVREGIYQLTLVQLIGNVLGTAKNYFPIEIDGFIKRDIVGLSFPGISKYKEDILDYNPSGETLSDLFTHKFGNFLMWALINEKAVKDFASKAINESITSQNSFEWYDKVVRILFKEMFGVKL